MFPTRFFGSIRSLSQMVQCVSNIPNLNTIRERHMNKIYKIEITVSNLDHEFNRYMKNYMKIYSARICLKDGVLFVSQTLESDDIEQLMKDINEFISNEIKL